MVVLVLAVTLSGCAPSNIINAADVQKGLAPQNQVVTRIALDDFVESSQSLSDQACLAFSSATKTQTKNLQKKIAKLERLASESNRSAKKFIETTDWNPVIAADDFKEEFLPERDAAFLKSFVESQMAKFKSKSGKHFDQAGIAAFEGDYFKATAQTWFHQQCTFDFTLNSTYNELARQYNSSYEVLTSMADSVPWYPNGYSIWSGDDNLAWKWVNGGTCNLGDSCWHVSVVAENQCTSLYAELSITDSSGADVDWTNDSAPVVVPGRPVLLEFDTYNPDAQSGSLVTLNCY